MNGTYLLIIGVLFFIFMYRFYGRYLNKLFGIDPERKTPAHKLRDDVDYVPSKPSVLFGHHFASIAGAGPIVGPVLGGCFGWVPVAIWILLGAVFIGAFHDFAALVISVRNKGRSLGHVIEDHIGYSGRIVFLIFCWAALILVIAIFAILVAKTFVGKPAVATSSMLFIAMAPLFGYLVYKKGMSIITASIIFVPFIFLFVWLGTIIPLDLTIILGISKAAANKAWLIILFIYIAIASIVPVWILLQPRDYLNSYLLYAMLLLGFLGVLIAYPSFKLPAFSGLQVTAPKGGLQWALFPILYVTVACGACSGFHALVASGTTAKQIDNEKHLLPIGFGSMLIEGILALIALTSIAILTRKEFIHSLNTMGPVNTFAAGVASFMACVAIPKKIGLTFSALAISAFMLTTLDTATRLARFTLQELFLPSKKEEEKQEKQEKGNWFTNRYTSTLITVLIAGYLAFSGEGSRIWPVFGASNQLLAALTLLVVTIILAKAKKNFWTALLPMIFMTTMSIWALYNLLRSNYSAKNWTLVIATLFLLITASIMFVRSGISLTQKQK